MAWYWITLIIVGYIFMMEVLSRIIFERKLGDFMDSFDVALLMFWPISAVIFLIYLIVKGIAWLADTLVDGIVWASDKVSDFFEKKKQK